MDGRDRTPAELEMNPMQKKQYSVTPNADFAPGFSGAVSPACSTQSGNISDSSAISVGDDTEVTAPAQPPGFSNLGRLTLGAEESGSKYNSTFYRHAGLVRTPSGRWRQQAHHASALLYGGTPVAFEGAWQDRVWRARLAGEKPWWVLFPDNFIVTAWTTFMFIPLIYVALVTPYRIFLLLPDTPEWSIVEGLLWGAFVVDIIFNFITAYEDEQSEEMVVDPKRIAKRYAKTWMIVDVIASIPFDFIFPAEDGGASSANRLGRLARLPRAIRVLRLLRLLRLLRVARLQGYLSRFEQITDLHPAIARAFAAAFWVLLSLHFMSCLWFFIGTEQNGDSWVKEEGLTDADSWTAYLTSMYWIATVVTSTGFGDIVPLSLGERGFTILVQLLGVAWTGLVVSTMATIFASLDRQHSTIKQHRRQLEYFMRDARLPRKLKQRVLKSFEQTEHDSLRASAQHTSAILDMLAPSVRKAVVLYTNRKLLHLLPPLQREEDEVQAFIVERLVRIHAAQGEFVCVEQTFATHMFWLARGRVNLFSDHERVTSYGSGSFFGVADVLFSPLRVASVQAITECELYSLSREDLQMVCSEFEDFGRRMRRVALKRLGRYAEVLGRPLVPAEYLQRMMELGVSVGLTAQEVQQYAEATSVERIMGGNPLLLPSASFRIGGNRAGATAALQLDPRAVLGDVDIKSTRSLISGTPKQKAPSTRSRLGALEEDGALEEGGPEADAPLGGSRAAGVSRFDSMRPQAAGHSAGGGSTLQSIPSAAGPDASLSVQRQGSRVLGVPQALGSRGRRRSFSFGDAPYSGSPRVLAGGEQDDDIIPVASIRSQASVQRSPSHGSAGLGHAVSAQAALQQSHLMSPLDVMHNQDRQLAQAVLAARAMHPQGGGAGGVNMGGMQPAALRKAMSQGHRAGDASVLSPPAVPPARAPAAPAPRAEAFPAESKREAPRRLPGGAGVDAAAAPASSLGSHASAARAVHFQSKGASVSLDSEARSSASSARSRRRRRVKAAGRVRVPAGRRLSRDAQDGYRSDSGGSMSSGDSVDYGDMASPKAKKRFDLLNTPPGGPADPPSSSSLMGYHMPRRDAAVDALASQVSSLQAMVAQLASGQAETNAALQRLLSSAPAAPESDAAQAAGAEGE